ncbi:alkaline phosphatase family protein [Oceanibacterium hippocampi]|uniref:Arylsulfatase n=1 Tax=Oceanibacterium hippocampi TaxID=745714 RepID=A0A1Y5SBV0_9PROT|nr:alkaline phosphatase family protein [Oceanibacterium hippocampi]SLN36394.1 Arylsulfatase [Oceanibacterium hippocampi]
MARQPNILFIMADQLRADYLGCYGHPTIRTPNLDRLAADGTRFTRAYAQAPVCGGSRMSFYTGRYAYSHGAAYNNYPLRLDEWTIGDYLRPQGYRVALVGKTHMEADLAGFRRLGIDPGSGPGLLARECGFEPFERDDGLHPDQVVDPNLAYNRWLNGKGYPGANPWHDYANSVEGPDGEVLSGWYMRNSHLPARVAEAHSETAYMTDRAMEFITEAGETPWCLHLSYIKPHWPYVAPAPYHAMYGHNAIQPANRTAAEAEAANPVVRAFMAHEESLNFARDEVRERVIPAYMGLTTQLDDHLGRLFAFLQERGIDDNTIIVFTSDHGDYLGDHWLGEKDLFHEESVRIPLIVRDPRPRADGGRGRAADAFAEAIDLAPSFLDWAGGEARPERLEGRSLAPLLAGQAPSDWRDAVFSDSCFAQRPARITLGLDVADARAFMVRTERWKYVHFEKHPPLLHDLGNDPAEQHDLGRDPGHEAVRAEMRGLLFDWLRRRRLRTTIGDALIARKTGNAKERGYLFGVW